MARRSIALLATALGMLLAFAAAAAADTGNIVEPQNQTPETKNGFQAGTCTFNQDPSPPNAFCSAETPSLFHTQAGGHPPVGFTQYIIRHGVAVPGVVEPVEDPFQGRTIKTLRVDLPPGLTVNPQATPHCSIADFEAIQELKPGVFGHLPKCSQDTQVGLEEVTLVTNVAGYEPEPGVPLPKGYVIAPDPAKGTKVPVYNLEPKEGEPARFGFVIAFSKVVYLETEVAWENDFHESFTIKLPEPSAPFSTLKSRLVNFGFEAGNIGPADAGDGTYISNPTTCFDPVANPSFYSTWFRAESWDAPNAIFPTGSTAWEAPLPDGAEPTGCVEIPFDPSIEASVTTSEVDSPTGGTVVTKLPFKPEDEGGEEGIMQSHLRKAEVTLPIGMGLNPSGSKTLADCKDSQFKKGQRVFENECPDASKVGSAEITSAPLAEPLVGDIYVGEQKSMDPASGEEFRILVEAKSAKEGIVVRLVGNVKANPATGQLTAVFTDQLRGQFSGQLPEGLPQVPFEAEKLSFDAAKQVLTSPPICAPADTTGAMEPWARRGTTEPVSDTFTLSSVPGGGPCPTTLAERKFGPAYDAATGSPKAGAYSPFKVHIGRPDGQQEVKGATVTLPKGLTGKLAGIPYCSEAQIAAAAAAAGKSGTTCPAASRIGGASTASGTGAAPLRLGGTAYLAGPYKGAPLSMAIVTPAVSGPFDLGTVVVRVALNVDPETAQITAVSDEIPDVFGGVKLDIRAIDVDVDRQEFMKNPTNCSAQATTGTLNGGGGDPGNPAAWSSYAVKAPYQADECRDLGFKPKFFTRLKGPTKRDGNPQLRAIVEARKGDANIARTALTMPHALFLDQDHIGTVCTRAQLASRTCPKNSIYGQAEAVTPLLDRKLKGPVYLVANPAHELPDLLADLRGQVNIQLRGVISSKRGGIKTVFNGLPDVPVKKFILNMKGGKKSLLVNSENTCTKRQTAVLNIKAQNSRLAKNNKFGLNIVGCKGKKK
jgi:hypothetical protein